MTPISMNKPSLGLPWNLPHYRQLDGLRPLVESFVKNNPFVQTHVLQREIQADDEVTAAALLRLSEQIRPLDAGQTASYLYRLNFLDQLCMESQGAAFQTLFQHTAPVYCGAKPWIFHFESLPGIFSPFIKTGQSARINLRDKAYFQKIKRDFESEQCRAIFTNISGNQDILSRVFDSPAITRKLHHIPIGIGVASPTMVLRKFEASTPLRILFTNAQHQDPASFYVCGGHHLLKAFQLVRKTLPEAELTMLSPVPGDLAKWFSDSELEGVKWIADEVDEATLNSMYLSHHMVALPSAGLRSFCMLRAMANGCIPLISDVPGYEEYTRNLHDSVLRIGGVREQIYQVHPEGWLSEDYSTFINEISSSCVEQIYRQIVSHSSLDALRVMGVQNMVHCKTWLTPAASHTAFQYMVRASA